MAGKTTMVKTATLRQIGYYLAVLSIIYGNAELCRYIHAYMRAYNIQWLSIFGLELLSTGWGIIYFMAIGLQKVYQRKQNTAGKVEG